MSQDDFPDPRPVLCWPTSSWSPTKTGPVISISRCSGRRLCWSATRIRQAAAKRAHAGVHCRLRTGWLARDVTERRCRGCGQRLVFGVGQQLAGLAPDLPAGLVHEGAEAPDLRTQPFVVPAQPVVVCLQV
jgi:hypothetical protein